MNSPEILYVSGSYIPAAGGAEQTMHTLMTQLQKRDFNCRVVTRKESNQLEYEEIDGVSVTRISSAQLENSLRTNFENNRPDIVFTQLMWSDRTIRICNLFNIPTIYFIRSTGGNLDISTGGEFEVTEVVSNSSVTQEFIRNAWGRESIVMHPLIDFDKYKVDKHIPTYISMVNPVQPKGGEVFVRIAQSMPSRNFLVAQGWDFLKDASGKWDLNKMQEMADAHRDTLHIAQDIDLTNISNILISGPYRDMREFYKRSRIVLMPSLWEEAFGRTVVEAMINRIPVIASNRGNLKETIGEGGILIDDPLDIQSWVKAIRLLDDPEFYASYQERAYGSAQRFNMETESMKIVSLVKRLLKD